MWLSIVLMLLGLAFVIAEVFFVSMGLLSVVAGSMVLAAAYTAFQHSPAFGWTIVVLQVVLIPVIVRLAFLVLPKLPFGRQMLLDGPATAPVRGLPDHEELQGRKGMAVTPLRPSGVAVFEGERVSVVAAGAMIPKDTQIVVVQVEGNEVRVRPTGPLPDDEAQESL